MPNLTTWAIPSPRSWEEFEDLMLDLYKRIWRDPDAQGHGRSGHAQCGIDIYGRPEGRSGRFAGVQCKRYERSRITKGLIEEEIGLAETFRPPLCEFTIATTLSRSVALQKVVRELQETRRREGRFPIQIVFWEDIQSELKKPENKDLLEKYFGTFFLQDEENVSNGVTHGEFRQGKLYTPKPPLFYDYQNSSMGCQTNLIGRDADLALIKGWLNESDPQFGSTRVGILVGIGGEGKTVLAAKVFRDLQTDTPGIGIEGGFWWSFYYPDSPDTSLDRFSIRDLTIHLFSYLTGAAIEESTLIPPNVRQQQILDQLNRRKILLVLDGVERVLVAYASMYAAYQDDFEPDSKLALAGALETEEGTKGLPARRRKHSAVDHRMGQFLLRLAKVSSSRTIMTTRRVPADLEVMPQMLVEGAVAWNVEGLTADGVFELLNSFGCRVSRSDSRMLRKTLGGQPLALKLIAEEVVRSEPPGDFAAWYRSNRGALISAKDVARQIERVVKWILNRLDSHAQMVLGTIAIFRAPVGFATLQAILVGKSKTIESREHLVAVLGDLRDRGFTSQAIRTEYVGVEAKIESIYEMHPAVRAIVRRSADPGDWGRIAVSVHDHYSAFTVPTVETVADVNEMSPIITVFHCLLEASQFKEAFGVYFNRIMGPLHFRLSSIDAEIMLLLALAQYARETPSPFTLPDRYHILAKLSVALCLAGSPNEAYTIIREADALLSTAPEQKEFRPSRLINMIPSLVRVGLLREAHLRVTEALAQTKENGDTFRSYIASIHLGLIESLRGNYQVASRILNRIKKLAELNADRHSAALAIGHLIQLLVWSGRPAHAIRLGRDFLEEELRRRWVRRDSIRALYLLAMALARSNSRGRAREFAITEGLALVTQALEASSNLGIGDYEIDIHLVKTRLHLLAGDGGLASAEGDLAERQAREGGYRFKLAEALLLLAQCPDKTSTRAILLDEARSLATADDPSFSCVPILTELSEMRS